MNVLTKIAIIIILSLVSYVSNAQKEFKLTVNIEEANSNEGQMMIALYNSESDFLDKIFKGAKSEISNNGCTVSFENVPEGTYAVSIFHDENKNDKLDGNFIGIPKEDYGCSNNAKGFMGPPKWKDAKFELKEDKSITITL
ncbi:DUF2141 domain-containing protein [Winogradskyella sp. KYW1333]|jgi:uncharacterized protein (DUF2141 family)|uniref:DUF2141 domain-containing protein n=1 Tax=unclassified Winogradskyella TaxID=2615021 RepID=UPI000DF3337A|nr:DUF2141 domain-containing protein [Winogradskyella sp. KYW1333]RCT55171.1 DUF2141 domain-containing protein [Winogradskyella sp. KYW1333]